MKTLAPELSQELGITCHHSNQLNPNGLNVVLVAFEQFSHPLSPRTSVGREDSSTSEESAGASNPICWDTVLKVSQTKLQYSEHVNIWCYQLRNIYHFISRQILRCWQKHEPTLFIVVGSFDNYEDVENEPWLRLEQVAKGKHFLQDVTRNLPDSDCCSNSGDLFLKSHLDLHSVARDVTSDNIRVKAEETIGGYYLCDYAYYHALYYGPQRSFCLRIPNGNGLRRGEDYVPVITKCITSCLDQLHVKGLLRPQ